MMVGLSAAEKVVRTVGLWAAWLVAVLADQLVANWVSLLVVKKDELLADESAALSATCLADLLVVWLVVA
jgi:hypothetical protein